jgi:hypothetical protein
MMYELTKTGEGLAYRVGGLLIYSEYGQQAVDIADIFRSPGPEIQSVINLAEELGYITKTGNLVSFTPDGVSSVALLYAIWAASIRNELEPTEHFVPVNEESIIMSLLRLERVINDVGSLFLATTRVTGPIPSRKDLQRLIDEGLLVRHGI